MLGLKFLSKSKLFGEGPSCLHHPTRCQPYIQDILLCHWTDFTVYIVFLFSFVNILGNILLVCIISIGMCDDISNMESASACFHICWLAYPSHTSNLSREPRVYPCKFFLTSVNFYRFNTKNWHFRQILYNKMCIIIYFLPISSHKMCEASAEHILWHWNR